MCRLLESIARISIENVNILCVNGERQNLTLVNCFNTLQTNYQVDVTTTERSVCQRVSP